MTYLSNIEQMLALPVKTKVTVIENGDSHPYIIAGPSPVKANLVIAVDDGCWTKARVFTANDFKGGKDFLVGEYDSATVGEAMRNQLRKRIETVEKVYLKSK